MPPRLPNPTGLKGMTLCLRPASSTIPVATPFTPLIQKATIAQKERAKLRKAKLDPYRWQLAQNRKNANLKRREELKAEREAAWGDPVQGKLTPFVESFDSAGQARESEVRHDDEGKPLEQPHVLPTSKHILNFQLTKQELDEAIQESYELTRPATDDVGLVVLDQFVADQANDPKRLEAAHEKAVEALRRITSLDIASSKDRRHANIRRIIEKFGRHRTDGLLRPKAPTWDNKEPFQKIRGGPDTGSSEVQIAILTAKIRVLSKMLAGPKGNKDKHNKKNLRLLCHRRQKLLKYMERKERGSGRWEHMLETLGLTEATWKRQIEIR